MVFRCNIRYCLVLLHLLVIALLPHSFHHLNFKVSDFLFRNCISIFSLWKSTCNFACIQFSFPVTILQVLSAHLRHLLTGNDSGLSLGRRTCISIIYTWAWPVLYYCYNWLWVSIFLLQRKLFSEAICYLQVVHLLLETYQSAS